MQPDGLGTNPMTHVTAPLEKASSISPMLLVLSAADEEGIGRLAESYSQYFAKLDETLSSEYLNDLAFTLSTRRSSLAWKSYTIVDSVLSLQNIKHAMAKPARTPFNLRLGFAFTGQGAQWFAMGRELMNYSIFKKSLIRSQTYLTTLLCDWNLFSEFWTDCLNSEALIHCVDELEKDESRSRVSEPEFSQTLSTAIQIALVDLFTWLDIAPAVVVGHSSGEIAAAFARSNPSYFLLPNWSLGTALDSFRTAPPSELRIIGVYLLRSLHTVPSRRTPWFQLGYRKARRPCN